MDIHNVEAHVIQRVAKKTNTNTTVATNGATEGREELSTTVADARIDAGFLKNINFTNPSWDLFIVLFFVIGALLYGFSLGRDRIVVIMVSIFMALAIVDAMPSFVLNVAFNGQKAFQVTTFLSLFVVFFFLISRSALLRTLGSGLNNGKWYQTLIFSILHVGLLLSITMSMLPSALLTRFAPQTQQLFTAPWPHFAWIVAPIMAMMIFGGSESDDD